MLRKALSNLANHMFYAFETKTFYYMYTQM